MVTARQTCCFRQAAKSSSTSVVPHSPRPSICPNITIKSSASGFGKAIAVIGDIDADGEQEIAIGAPNAVINTYRDTGSVYIVKGSATGTVTVDSAPAALMVRIDGGGFSTGSELQSRRWAISTLTENAILPLAHRWRMLHRVRSEHPEREGVCFQGEGCHLIGHPCSGNSIQRQG